MRRAFEHCGATVFLTDSPQQIEKAGLLVLPGVGAFGDGMKELDRRNLIGPIQKHAAAGHPFLGICLGMQMLMSLSEEFGVNEGLGLIQGKVMAIPNKGEDGVQHKIPHIGWNRLMAPAEPDIWKKTILSETAPGQSVYFVHSFMAEPVEKSARLADCDYNGIRVSAVIQKENVYGCQFHPEKSGEAGLKMLSAFCRL